MRQDAMSSEGPILGQSGILKPSHSLITKYEVIFPQKKEPWYQVDDEDVRK
jgi:hypothetical protein